MTGLDLAGLRFTIITLMLKLRLFWGLGKANKKASQPNLPTSQFPNLPTSSGRSSIEHLFI